MVVNTKFLSLPVHSYQKQSFLMIILAVRGQEKNLVIDRNSIRQGLEYEKVITRSISPRVGYTLAKLYTKTLYKVIFTQYKTFFTIRP